MNGAAAILQSVKDGDVSIVERLLSDDPGAGAELEATTSWGATPLDWAAQWLGRMVCGFLTPVTIVVCAGCLYILL